MGPLLGVGITYSINLPSRVRKPILFASNSVKRTPMAVWITDVGPLAGVGIGNCLKTAFDAIAGARTARKSLHSAMDRSCMGNRPKRSRAQRTIGGSRAVWQSQ